MDTLLSVPYLPNLGATVSATGLTEGYGGKGANQAMAAALQGANVSLIACVGNDDGGTSYINRLLDVGIDVSGVQPLEGIPSGQAYITVDPEGQNTIVTATGANGYLTADLVLEHHLLIHNADALLCQLEVPVEAVVTALQHAAELGVTTILNPSPPNMEFPWGQVTIDFLIVNEEEAEALLGHAVESTQEAASIRSQMVDLGVQTLIITRGAQHTFAFSPNQALKVPPPVVDVVDTVGAGDSFAGAFAVHWASTHNLLDSLRKANTAAAISTQMPGAQESLPTLEQVENFGKTPLADDEEGGDA